MCLLVVCPPGEVLSDKHIETAWRYNPNGGGFAHIGKAGRIRPFRSMSLKAMKMAYHAAVKQYPNSPFMVHFRLATHGKVNLDNVHPFKVNHHTYMAHNGILSDVVPRGGMSDSKTFAKDWLSDLPRDFLDNWTITALIEEFTMGSKLAFLTTDPQLREQWYILNEGHGHWRDNKWYSNNTYVEFTPAKYVDECDLCGDVTYHNICFKCEICQECDDWIEECSCELAEENRALVARINSMD